MINWIYFVLIAQGIWALTSLIDKIVISKGHIKNPLVYIVLNGAMNVFLIFLLPFVGFQSLKFIDIMIALFYGATFSASVAIYYKAVEYDDISRIVVLLQFAPIFVLFLSFLFLGELLTLNHFIGFLFLLSASIIVSYKKVESSFKLSKSFYLMLGSALLSAIAIVSAKHIFNVTSFWSGFLWLRFGGFMALCVLVMPSVRNEFVKTFATAKSNIKALLLLKMVIDFSAFIFLNYAILKGPISLVSALGSSVLPLFVFILALFTSLYMPRIIKEEINKKSVLIKLLAFGLVVAGIIFINMGY